MRKAVEASRRVNVVDVARGDEGEASLIITRARSPRRTGTDAENLMWKHLRARRLGGHKFRRQVPIGRYIADFLCEEAALIVELDGGQHADNQTYDEARSHWLGTKGFHLLRFWNNDVLTNTESVLEKILQIATRRTTTQPT